MKTLLLICLVLILFISAACSHRQLPTPTDGPPPTDIVYPATWTPVPTHGPTPIPPTATPNPGTAAIIKAVKNTDGLNVYSAEQNMTISNATLSFFGEQAGSKFTFFHIKGSVNNKDSNWLMDGMLIRELTGDPQRSVAVLQLGNKVYIQGPLPTLGASENKWYYADSTTSGELFNSTDTRNKLDLLASSRATPPPFDTVGVETLDKHPCTHYHAAGMEVGKYLTTVEIQQSLSNNTLNFPIDQTNPYLEVWVCDDGYIHRVDVGFTMQCGCKANDHADFTATIHLSDMNIIIPVQAPAGAVPLNKQFQYPTPVRVPVQTS